jgi:hypothetical protein
MFHFVRMLSVVASTDGLRVDVHFGRSAAVPGGKQHATATALVLDILERGHEVGNETQAAGETADTQSPCAISTLAFRQSIGSTVSRAVDLNMV